MSASFVCIAFLALSGSTMLGYLLAALMCANKMRDLEAAYLKLACAFHHFLCEIPEDAMGIVVLSNEDVFQMRRVLEEAEAMAGVWTIEDYRR